VLVSVQVSSSSISNRYCFMSRAKESIHWVVIGLVLLVLVPAGLVYLSNQDSEDEPERVVVEKKVRLKDRADILSR
jgi:hypothetical protein